MGNHDDFDLDVRLGNSRSSMEASQPQNGNAPNFDPTAGDTCNSISCGGTCADADTCLGHNTCDGEICNLISNNTCLQETCNLTCNGGTCDTCHGGNTCLGGDTCISPDCIPVETIQPPPIEGNP